MNEQKQTLPEKFRLRGKTCLIVDDDPGFCAVAAAAIRREMGRPVIRCSGVGALAFLEQKSCDLAVIDLTMPQIDGFRLISFIRHMSNYRQLPIAVATSRLDIAARAEAARLKIACFMTKPINWSDFAKCLAEMLQDTHKSTPEGSSLPEPLIAETMT